EDQRLQQVKGQLPREVEGQQHREEEAWTPAPLQKHAAQLHPPAPHSKEPPPAPAHPAPYLPGRPQSYTSPPQILACSCRARATPELYSASNRSSTSADLPFSSASWSLRDLISSSRAVLRVVTLIPRWKRRRSVPRLQADLRTLVGGFLPTTLTGWGRGQSRDRSLGGADAALLWRRRRVVGAAWSPTTLSGQSAKNLVIHSAMSTKPEPTRTVDDMRSWQVDAFTRVVSTWSRGRSSSPFIKPHDFERTDKVKEPNK
ncbi:hypothetical protein CUMW_188790, partial [Citrus unshiu]